MTSRTITHILNLAGLVCILLSGCISEEMPCPGSQDTPQPEGENILRLQLSCRERSYRVPSRAGEMEGSAEENRINTLSVYIYNEPDGKLQQAFPLVNVENNPEFQKSGTLVLTGVNSSTLQGKKRIYVVANTPRSMSIPETFSELLGVTTPKITGEISSASPLIMSGEKIAELSMSQPVTVHIDLERLVAKIRVKVGRHDDCPGTVRVDYTGITVQMRNVPEAAYLYNEADRVVGDNSPIRNIDYSMRATKVVATSDEEVKEEIIDYCYVNENPYITAENSRDYGTALEISIPTIKTDWKNEEQEEKEEIRVVDTYIVYVNGGQTLRNHVYTLSLRVKDQGSLPGVELSIAPWDEYITDTPVYGSFLELSAESVAVPAGGVGQLLFRTAAPSVRIDWSTDTEGWMDHSLEEIQAPAGVEQGSSWNGVLSFRWAKLPNKDTKVRVRIVADNLSKYVTLTCGAYSEVIGGDNGIVVPDWEEKEEDMLIHGTYIAVPTRELRSSVAEMPFFTDAEEVTVDWSGDPENMLVHDTTPIRITGNRGVLKLNWTGEQRPTASEDIWVGLCAGNIKVRIYIRYSDGADVDIPEWENEEQDTPIDGVELVLPSREVYIYNGASARLAFYTNASEEEISVDWKGDTEGMLDHDVKPVVSGGEGYMQMRLASGKVPDSYQVIPLVLKTKNVSVPFSVICEDATSGDIPGWNDEDGDLTIQGTYLILEQNTYNLKDTSPLNIPVRTDASKIDITWEGNTELLDNPPSSVAVTDGKASITCKRSGTSSGNGNVVMTLHAGNIIRRLLLTFNDPLPEGSIPNWDEEDKNTFLPCTYLATDENVSLRSGRRAGLDIRTDAAVVRVDWSKAPNLVHEQSEVIPEGNKGMLYLKWSTVPTSTVINTVVLSAGPISRMVTVTWKNDETDNDQALATYIVLDKEIVPIPPGSASCEVRFRTDSRSGVKIDWSMDRENLLDHTTTTLRTNEGAGSLIVSLAGEHPGRSVTIPVTLHTENISQTVFIKIEP